MHQLLRRRTARYLLTVRYKSFWDLDRNYWAEIEILSKNNNQLQTQIYKYENMLSKMNQEYEKLLIQSSENEKLVMNLKRELSNLKATSSHNITIIS